MTLLEQGIYLSIKKLSIQIVLKAHEWLGTKFKHQGRIKKSAADKGGCDCLGLIMGLEIKTKDHQLLSNFDQSIYPKLINSNVLYEQLNLLLNVIDKKDIRPGDIILIKFNNWPQHLGVVVEKKENIIVIIHSYLQARQVIKQILPDEWYKNIAAVYRSS